MNKILIIDDDKELCTLIKRSVLSEEIEADICNSGREGIQQLKEQTYQLVILDVMMPGMDGFETLEEIKKNSLNKFDYSYAKTFLEHVANYYMGEDVILSNGREGKILQINTENISKPLILVDGEFVDLNKEKDMFIKELIVR